MFMAFIETGYTKFFFIKSTKISLQMTMIYLTNHIFGSIPDITVQFNCGDGDTFPPQAQSPLETPALRKLSSSEVAKGFHETFIAIFMN